MNPIAPFMSWLRARRAAHIAAREEHRRAIIKQQIASRKASHREFRPLYGDLNHATHRAMAYGLGREWK